MSGAVAAGELTVRQLLTQLAELEMNGLDGESLTLQLFEQLTEKMLDTPVTETHIQARRQLFIGTVLVACRCFHFGGMVAAVAIVDALTEQLQGTVDRAPRTLTPFIEELTVLAVREFLEKEMQRDARAAEAETETEPEAEPDADATVQH